MNDVRSVAFLTFLGLLGCSSAPPPRLAVLPVLLDSFPTSPVVRALRWREEMDARLRPIIYRTGSQDPVVRAMMDSIRVHATAFQNTYGMPLISAESLATSWRDAASQIVGLQMRDRKQLRSREGKALLEKEIVLYSRYCSSLRDAVLCHESTNP